MNQLSKVNGEIKLPGCRLTRTGIIFDKNVTEKQWERAGDCIQFMVGATLFGLGDWYLHGENHYPDASQSLQETGYEYGTLQNATWVCRKIEISRRRENLSFSIHQEVASLKSNEDQDFWLEKAEKEKWQKQELREAIKKHIREEKINKIINNDASDANIIHGEFQTEGHIVKDESVDLIFTDPPYDLESVPLYGDLAIFASRVLKKGGSLICYVGHYAIPQILELMSPHLRFWWIISCKHSGNAARLPGKWVFVEWKPMLWFVKEERSNKEFIADFIQSDEPSKELHDWQQGLKEAEYYIEHLTDPGSMICDPFCGTGTTCRAAIKIGRKYISFEKEKETVAIARHLTHEFKQTTHSV